MKPGNPRRSGNIRQAFTLIELLVVIAIISILASMMFPSFNRIRESARRSACPSNLKQLGMGIRLYTQDNDERLPYAGNFQGWANGGAWVTGGEGNPPVPTNYTDAQGGLAALVSPFTYQTGRVAIPEQGAIYSYVKNSQVYICPSTEYSREKKLSYSMNCAVAGAMEGSATEASAVILLVDEGKTLNDGFFWSSGAGSATDELTQFHNGGGNLLFLDGHVKAFPFARFPLDNTPTGLANKTSQTANPRFRDPGLGTNGVAQTGFPGAAGLGGGSACP